MYPVDQKKKDLAPLFQQEIDKGSSGLVIEPNLVSNDFRWDLVDLATSEVVGSFTLGAPRVAILKTMLDDYARGVLENALLRLRAEGKLVGSPE
jgi:hypothetical protein